MPRICITLNLTDEEVAHDTGRKLLGRDSPIKRRIAEALMRELVDGPHITVEFQQDPYKNQTLVRASIIVGQEHMMTPAQPDYLRPPYV